MARIVAAKADTVLLDRHGKPAAPAKPEGSAAPGSRVPVDGSLEALQLLDRRRQRLDKTLAASEALQGRKASGDQLDANQLGKLARAAAVAREAEEAKQQWLSALRAATPTVRTHFGCCASCGSPGHAAEHCPRPSVVRSAGPAVAHAHAPAHGPPPPPPPPLPPPPKEQKVHNPSVASVLVVAEKPSVAKTIAKVMSGDKVRTRQGGRDHTSPLRLFDFFTYFPPAKGKCAATLTGCVAGTAQQCLRQHTPAKRAR